MGCINEDYLGGFRKDTISIEELCMETAELIAKRSLDPSTQVGVCYEKDGEIISVGFNRPVGKWNPNRFPFRNDVKTIGIENTKYLYTVHAECAGIKNAKGLSKLEGATAYVTLFPCPECAKAMADNGIARVVYKDRRIVTDMSFDPVDVIFENCGIESISYEELLKNKTTKILTFKNKNEGL